MTKKLIVNIFPRNKYPASAGGKTYQPRDRKKLMSMIGGADQAYFQTRVYARDANVTLNFDVLQGSFGDEPPAEGPRPFALAKSNLLPNTLPWDSGNMANLPDDGMFSVNPGMGLTDFLAVAGGATGSVEFETWATLIYKS